MTRTFRNLACFFMGMLLAAPMLVHAAASLQTLSLPGVSQTPSGSTFTYPTAANQASSFPDSLGQYATSGRATIPRAAASIDVPVKIATDVARLPSATLVFLRKPLMVVGVALATYALICTYTSICHDSNNVLTAPDTSVGAGYTTCSTSAYQGTDCPGAAAFVQSSYPDANAFWSKYDASTWVWGTAAGSYSSVHAYTSTGTVPMVPATDTQIQSSLNALTPDQLNAIAQDLAQLHEPVPITVPVIIPVSVPGTTTTTVNRDAAGNPVSTTTTSDQINVNPANNAAQPLQVSTTIITTTTTVDNNNNVVNSSTTTVDPAPPQDAPVIKFDDATDIKVPTGTFSPTFTPTTWGEGTCPGDPSFSASGHNIVIPLHVVCGAMSMLRPVVLLIASVVSGYIVLGVRK